MNALLSVLAPPPEARDIHRRLGHLLQKTRHMLLRAQDPVEGLPPAPPKPPRVRGPRENLFRTRSNTADRALVLSVITADEKKATDIREATGLTLAVVRSCLRDLVDRKLVQNAAPSGSFGRYSLPKVAAVSKARGPFDV